MSAYWDRFGLTEGEDLLALGATQEALEPLRLQRIELGHEATVAPMAVLEFGEVGAASLDMAERVVIEHALRSCNGDKMATARRLAMGKSTLYRKLRRHGIAG